MISTLDLTNTAEALKKYDELLKINPTKHSPIINPNEYESWQGLHGNAVADVQAAFYEDTSDRNTLEECSTIGIVTLRRWVEEWENSKHVN